MTAADAATTGTGTGDGMLRCHLRLHRREDWEWGLEGRDSYDGYYRCKHCLRRRARAGIAGRVKNILTHLGNHSRLGR